MSDIIAADQLRLFIERIERLEEERKALADDNPAGLPTIVTPLDIRNTILHAYEDLVALPCYSWSHVVVVPRDHALAQEADRGLTLTLPRLSEFALITYESGYTGRSHIDEAFRRQSLAFDLVLSAMDADVINADDVALRIQANTPRMRGVFVFVSIRQKIESAL